MELGGDLRSVLNPRSAVNATVQRLIDATESCSPVTLSVRNAATLLTLIEAATRIAQRVRDDLRKPQAVNATQAEVSVLAHELRQATEAWEASERALWRKDLEAL